jgi:Raf kinase inhibitor-like YbhB/YbcL family protein
MIRPFVSITLFLLLLSGCSSPKDISSNPGAEAVKEIIVTSQAFVDEEAIPVQYTCQGDDSSPDLSWTNPPEGTKSLALIVDDPDAPNGTWVHWVVYNLPAGANGLAKGASKGNSKTFNLPDGTLQGKSSFNRSDYGGPCPPSGTHHYFFKLYALDTIINTPGLDNAGLLKAMQGHVIGSGQLVGTFQKK